MSIDFSSFASALGQRWWWIKIRLSNRPLFRSELKEVSGLKNLSILKRPQETNFPVTDQEWKIISSLMKQQID